MSGRCNEDPGAGCRGTGALGLHDAPRVTGGRRPARSGPYVPLAPAVFLRGYDPQSGVYVPFEFGVKVAVEIARSEDGLDPGKQSVQGTEHETTPLLPTAEDGRWCRPHAASSRFPR